MTALSQPNPDLDTLAAQAVEGNKFERVGQNRFKESAGMSPTRTRARDGGAPDETPSQIAVSRWIEWTGGMCPVSVKTIVDVRFRDGSENHNYWAGFFNDCWYHEPCKTDIIAYRIVREA